MVRVGRWAVLVVWIGLLLALGYSKWPSHEVGDAAASGPAAAIGADDDEIWMGVYMRGEKIGYARSQFVPERDGYRIRDQSYLRLTVLEQVESVRLAIDAVADATLALESFALRVESDVGDFTVHGAVRDGDLALRITSGGDTREQHIALAKPLYLPESARARLRAAGLAPGRRVVLRVFDPSALQHHPLTFEVIGREAIPIAGMTRDAWKVRETFRGMQTTAWLDDAGRTLREEGPLGMVAEREDARRAVTAGWSTTPFDVIDAVAIRIARPIDHPRDLARLRARLLGTKSVTVPGDRRQTVREGVLQVDREAPVAAGTYVLPYTGAEWAAELRATPFLQVDHPRIGETARTIVAGERDPVRAAARLRAWVHDTLIKRPTASVPNAVQVLESRTGDCNEHAVLLAALARALGLPARVVAGLVYADGAFLYHAWNEVWVGSGWLSVDPAFDQAPADATHIKLVEGGPESHAALVPLLGTLSIELIEASEERPGA